MTTALNGIRAIDFTRLGPGPFCGMILGDLGAEVIRIDEPQTAGDDSEKARRRAAFNALNRNKRSIILNLKDPQAQEVLQRLCRDMDVFIEGFRPGVTTRLGCDYETLSAINPRIVYCSITGYGQDGPYRDQPGHDINYMALGGALELLGPEEGPPAIPPNIIADFSAGGMQAAIGIMAALMARERTGRGQYVDISMTDGVVYLMANLASTYFEEGLGPWKQQRIYAGRTPGYNVYECKDGKYMTLSSMGPPFWENICRVLDLPDYIPLGRDTSRYPEMVQAFREAFRRRTRDQWWEELRGGANSAGPVYSLDETLRDPQIQHRQMVKEVGQLGEEPVFHVGIAPKLSDTPGSVRRLAPLPGEHTAEVLEELGYSAQELAALRQKGAVT